MSERPLAVTADPDLLDELVRIAAAAGVELQVAAAASAAGPAWAAAPVVLVGDDVAATTAGSRPARRDRLVLVGRDLDDPGVWRRAVALGAAHVALLPDAEGWLVDVLADAVEGGAQRAPCVAVVGGRGGAGASTLAAALAVTAAAGGRRTLLVDADPLGGGLDLVLGAENLPGPRWPDLAGTRGRVSAATVHAALPRLDRLTLLSWDRGERLDVPPEAMTALLAAGVRGSDLVVVDVARRPDAAARAALDSATLTLLVVPAEVRAAAAAARVAATVGARCAALRVVVRGPAPGGLTADGIARSLGLPLAGELRPEPGLAATLERGDPPAGRGSGPLARWCARLLGELGSGRAAA